MPIDTMYDIAGAETDDPNKATACVVLLPDNRWMAAHCKPTDIQLIKLD